MDGATSSADTLERLQKLKVSLSKLTQQATPTRPWENHKSTDNQDATAENHDPNASFHLGMELFGQDVASLERNVQERLQNMEEELQDLVQRVAKETSGAVATDQSNDQGAARPSFSSLSNEELQNESNALQSRIQFLKECSTARSLLDESVTLSTKGLTSELNMVESAQRLVQSHGHASKTWEILERSSTPSPLLSSTLPTPTTLPDATTVIYDEIRSGQRRQKLDLIAQAVQTINQAVTIAETSLTVHHSPSHNSLLSAYDVLGIFSDEDKELQAYMVSPLEGAIRKLTNQLQAQIFGPVLEEMTRKGKANARTFFEPRPSGNHRRLEWTCADDDGGYAAILGTEEQQQPTAAEPIKEWADALSFIQRVIAFVADDVLLQRANLCNMVAVRLFGKPSALPSALNLEALGLESCRFGDDNGLLLVPLLQAMEDTCVPASLSSAELGQLHSMAESMERTLTPFIAELGDKNMLPMESQAKLSDFVSSFEHKYVENRRCRLLTKARNLLVDNDYHNTVLEGEVIERNKDDEALGIPDGMAVFKLHQAAVSDTAHKLMQLCRQVLDEAVEQQAVPKESPLAILPATLYRTAREMKSISTTEGSGIVSPSTRIASSTTSKKASLF
jgi:hypothetical protein